MSLHDHQYYSAKIFLKHYGGALNTLEQCTRQQGMAKQYGLASKGLLDVTKLKSNKNSKEYQAFDFMDGLFARYIPSLNGAKSYSELEVELAKGLDQLRKQTQKNS